MNQSLNNLKGHLNELPLAPKNLKVRMVLGDSCHIGLILLCLFLFFASVVKDYNGIKDFYKDFLISQNPEFIEAAVHGQCHIATGPKQSDPSIQCVYHIIYDGKTYQKDLRYIGFTLDSSEVKAVRHKNDPLLISTDLALKKLVSSSIYYLFCIALGIGLFVGLIYLFIKRFNVSYCIYEMNRGNTDLALLPICLDTLSKKEMDQEKDKSIVYWNYFRNKQVKMRHGGWFSSTVSTPYFITLDNKLYVLVVHNKETGNLLVVDERLNRFKMGKKDRKALREKIEQYVNQLE